MEMNLTFITSLTCITRFLLFQEKINCHLTFLTLLTPHYQSYLFLSAVYQATTSPSFAFDPLRGISVSENLFPPIFWHN